MQLVATVLNSIRVEVHYQNLADYEIKKFFKLRTS